METIKEKSSKQMQDLIVINNDRYEGYKTAAEETKDAELKALFNKFSLQSKQFSKELEVLLPNKNYTPDSGETKLTGKLYRVFMDVKAALSGKDRKAILSSCEFGEDTAKKTYDEVLQKPDGISSSVLDVLRRQRTALQEAHDAIKTMRDSA